MLFFFKSNIHRCYQNSRVLVNLVVCVCCMLLWTWALKGNMSCADSVFISPLPQIYILTQLVLTFMCHEISNKSQAIHRARISISPSHVCLCKALPVKESVSPWIICLWHTSSDSVSGALTCVAPPLVHGDKHSETWGGRVDGTDSGEGFWTGADNGSFPSLWLLKQQRKAQTRRKINRLCQASPSKSGSYRFKNVRINFYLSIYLSGVPRKHKTQNLSVKKKKKINH